MEIMSWWLRDGQATAAEEVADLMVELVFNPIARASKRDLKL